MAIETTRLRRTIRQIGEIGGLALLLAMAMAGLGVDTALAGSKLDQQNPFDPNTGGSGAGITMTITDGQTFTAGQTGSLDRVAVYLERDFGESLPPGNIFLDIYPTISAGTPKTNGPAIGSGSIATTAVSQAAGFVVFPLSQPAHVKKGTVYAIVVHADVSIEFVIAWDGDGGVTGPGPYPRGGNAQRADANTPWVVFPAQDHYFKTFVSARRHRHRQARPGDPFAPAAPTRRSAPGAPRGGGRPPLAAPSRGRRRFRPAPGSANPVRCGSARPDAGCPRPSGRNRPCSGCRWSGSWRRCPSIGSAASRSSAGAV